jgi:hypothetical protein
VISAPQHPQKAATLFNLHNCHDSLDERMKRKDSKEQSVLVPIFVQLRRIGYIAGNLIGLSS